MRRSGQQAGASAFDPAQRQFCAHQSPGLARPSASDPWRVLASICARLTAPRIAEALAAAANEGSASSPSTLITPSADARDQRSPARRNKRRRRRTCHSEPAAAASSGAAHANLYHRHSRHPQRRRPEIALVAIASGPYADQLCAAGRDADPTGLARRHRDCPTRAPPASPSLGRRVSGWPLLDLRPLARARLDPRRRQSQQAPARLTAPRIAEALAAAASEGSAFSPAP